MPKSLNQESFWSRPTRGNKLAFVALALVIFLPSLWFGFVWDDLPMVAENASLHRWETLWIGWGSDFWGLHDVPAMSGYWRPLVTAVHLSWMQLWGESPTAFHFLNLFLHGLAVLLALVIFHRLGLRSWGLWGGALFFAWHPLHAETVSFVSASPDLLAAVLGLAALYFSLTERNLWAFLCFGLALLAKESALAFLLVRVGFSAWGLLPSEKNLRSPNVAAWIGLGITYLAVHAGVTGGIGAREVWGGSWLVHLGTVTMLFPYELLLTLFPFGQTPTRAFPISDGLSDWRVWGGLALILSLLILFWIRRRRLNLGWLGLLLFFCFWLPSSNLVPAEGLIADRYLYLCGLGTALGVGWGMGKLGAIERFRPALVGLIVLGFLGWGVRTVWVSQFWKSEETLWQRAVKVSPDSPVAWNQWGEVLLKKQAWIKAARAFDEAVKLRPEYEAASFNRALTFSKQMRTTAAKRVLEEHLQRFEKDGKAYDLLATVQLQRGETEAALASGTQAVSLEPANWKLWFNHGTSLLGAGKYDQASEALGLASDLAPNRPEIWMNLAAAELYGGEFDRAITVYEEILQRWPENQKASAGLKALNESRSTKD